LTGLKIEAAPKNPRHRLSSSYCRPERAGGLGAQFIRHDLEPVQSAPAL